MDPQPAKMPRLMIPGGNGGTTINDLPDELLEKIISDIPTIEAVQTSVLCKRWEHLWKFITKLDLEQDSFETRQQFIEFVERLLVLCPNASRLEKFSLEFEANDQTERLNRWFREFIHPEIEELNIVVEKVDEPLVFPEHLFNSETLKKFQLSMPFILNIPDSIYWRCLKALTLKHVVFPDGQSAQRLFSGCHVLEELALLDCNWINVGIVCIACPLLKKLSIREWRDELLEDEDTDDDAGSEAGDDNNNNAPPRCRIVIVGNENLTHFAYDGDMINEHFLYCAQTVVNASVEVHTNEEFHGDAGYFVYMLLRALPNVKRLSISEDAADAILNSTHAMVQMPMFNTLKELVMAASFPIDLSSASFVALLRNSPFLESIEFVMGVTLYDERYEEFMMDPLPACFSSHLNKITTYSFGGMEGELDAIKYLLRVAPLLERFNIFCSMDFFDEDLGPEQIDHLYYQIIEYPMANEGCYIYLE